MINPTASRADAARVAILPLDCPTDPIRRLITSGLDTALAEPDRFQNYIQTALATTSVSATEPSGTEPVQEAVTFAALAALRIQKAEPFRGTTYEDREPRGSAERRMLQQPLWKHPGLSRLCLAARRYYMSTVQWLFAECLPPELQSEIASVLIAPDPVSSSDSEKRAYVADAPQELQTRYNNRVKLSEQEFRFSTEYASQCCQIPPRTDSHVPWLYDELSNLYAEGGVFVVPDDVFYIKLAEYGWYGWLKLVNIAYNTLHDRDIERLVEQTPGVDADIRGWFRRKNTVHTPYFGVENTENPKREWTIKVNEDLSTKPVSIEDKRLITVVDCIRAHPEYGFDDSIPVDRIFDALHQFFPGPQRPGNDITAEETLLAALKNASHSGIKVVNEQSEPTCRLSGPKITPFYPSKSTAATNIWDPYLLLRARQRQSEFQGTRRPQARNGSNRIVVDPILPDQYRVTNTVEYTDALDQTQRAAVTTPRTWSVQDVDPCIDPEAVPDLSRDEIVFVSRVALAMERLLHDYSLTTSMRPLRYRADGSRLEIDEERLIELGWLEEHPEGRPVLYTVPAGKREQLGVPNVSHDGYGEITTDEKSLHRRGVDRVAASLAAKPDVSQVVRYCDLWRLQDTRCGDVLREEDLLSKRIDVLAYANGTPAYAAGVETASNSVSKPRNCVEKLSALSEIIETSLVIPNPEHMWIVMHRLNDPDFFDLQSFPSSNPDDYGRSNWKEKLENVELLGQHFDMLHSYRSLEAPTIDPETDTRHSKIVGLHLD